MSDDAPLIDAVLAGDRAAADAFVARFGRFVWWILTHELGLSHDAAEDIHQEVFLRLAEDDYRRLRRWRREGPIVNYLGPIVRHVAFDSLRERTSRNRDRAPRPPDGEEPPARETADTEPGPEELAALRELRAAIEDCLRTLRPRDADLIRLRFFEGCTYAEIGESLAMTVNNVGVALLRAEDRLGRCLARRHPELLDRGPDERKNRPAGPV